MKTPLEILMLKDLFMKIFGIIKTILRKIRERYKRTKWRKTKLFIIGFFLLGLTHEPSTLDKIKDVSVKYCQQVALESATYKKNASVHLGRAHTDDAGVTVTVVGEAEFMNGFGAMIPLKYKCIFTAGALTKFDFYDN